MMKKPEKKKEQKTNDLSASAKGYIKQMTEDMKRHTAALAEHMEDRIIGISERFVDFDRKLDSHTEMLETHERWFENIDGKLNSHTAMFEAHRKRFDLIDQSLDSHTEMMGELAEGMAMVKEKVTSIEDTLKQKVNRDEFVVLERRVNAIEAV